MGQKTNPTIFRIGNTEEWKLKYFEKKSTESALYAFESQEVKKFINKFFKNNGLAIKEIKLYSSESSLHVFISYFLTLKSVSLITALNKTQKIKLAPQTRQYKRRKSYKEKFYKIKTTVNKYFAYQELKHGIMLKKTLKKNSLTKAKQLLQQERKSLKIRRIKFLKHYKKYTTAKNYKTTDNIETHFFLEQFFESLARFTNNRQKISITLQQLNKDRKRTIQKQKLEFIKKSLVQLRKFSKNKFFKVGVNTLFSSTTNNKSSNLLSEFIASQLKNLKRHNFFLKFIKTTLNLFSTKMFSKIKGIKIKIKGRFNGAPRAKHKIIKIGNGVPVLSLNSKIDYSESTAYTSNGTFGVKVWVCETSYKKLC